MNQLALKVIIIVRKNANRMFGCVYQDYRLFLG